MAVKKENQWRKRFADLVMATWPQSEIIKTHIGAFDSAGLPDLYIASRHAGQVWHELKYVPPDEEFDWREQPTPLQRERIRALYYAGAHVGLIVFFEEWWVSLHGQALLDAFKNPLSPKWDSADHRWQHRYLYPDGNVAEFYELVWASSIR